MAGYARWRLTVIPAFRRQKQEYQKFKTSLGYRVESEISSGSVVRPWIFFFFKSYLALIMMDQMPWLGQKKPEDQIKVISTSIINAIVSLIPAKASTIVANATRDSALTMRLAPILFQTSKWTGCYYCPISQMWKLRPRVIRLVTKGP